MALIIIVLFIVRSDFCLLGKQTISYNIILKFTQQINIMLMELGWYINYGILGIVQCSKAIKVILIAVEPMQNIPPKPSTLTTARFKVSDLNLSIQTCPRAYLFMMSEK